MAKKKRKLDPKLQAWITARRRHRLSHAHVQMARQLGLNPAKLGKIDNHDQGPWKAPLPEYIQILYENRFGRSPPENAMSIEEIALARERKKQARREAKAARRAAKAAETTSPPQTDSETSAPDPRLGGLLPGCRLVPDR